MEPIAYTYAQLSALKDTIVRICEEVADANPTAWKQAHNGEWNETSARYNDLCVQELRKRGIYAGRNGKRGGSQLSEDVLCFGLQAGERGAQDTSGRFPSIAIIDFIGGAGSSSARVGWGDVSGAAPGRFAEPEGLARVDGNGTSGPPPTAGEPPAPPPAPPVGTAPRECQFNSNFSQSLTDLQASLSRLEARVEALTDITANRIVENRIEIEARIAELKAWMETAKFNVKIPSLRF